MKKITMLSCIVLLLIIGFANKVQANDTYHLSEGVIEKIDDWIEFNKKEGKIPGLSVVVVKGSNTIYSKNIGYADIKEKRLVTSETLFELGSTSKAFTALGILNLAKEGLINLDDPITTYIPWFKMKYVGEHKGQVINGNVAITIRQLLHHTSGISFRSIGDIPIDNSHDALEKTVRTQVNRRLESYPGETYEYATINYDILGLVIQYVTNEKFEVYIESTILNRYGLYNTFLSREKVDNQDIASGYKIKFLKPVRYIAPKYRGNVPAGYYISNANDIERWLRIQLGEVQINNNDLIERSHVPNRTVAPNDDGSSYAYGWSVVQDKEGTIYHGGSNPNYSSYIILRTNSQLGIAILANLNSEYTTSIGNGIARILDGEKPKKNTTDQYISIDNIAFAMLLITLPIIITIIYLLITLVYQIISKQRKFMGNFREVMYNSMFLVIFILCFGYSLYRIPDVFFYRLPWGFIRVWAPQSLMMVLILLFIAITLFCFYLVLSNLFTKKKDRAYFLIAMLSIASGLGNAVIVFTINESLNRSEDYKGGLMLFFIMAIMVYVFGQRIVRVKLLNITNNLVFDKRILLINRFLGANYEKVEQLDKGRIHAVLNNDTEKISSFANVVITAITSIVTLICCFIYLSVINVQALLISFIVILFAVSLYYFAGRYANKLWEETRDIQNVFFGYIDSLMNGFKELKLFNRRLYAFQKEMESSCEKYRDKRLRGDLGFANVFVIGELLFTLVIGVVAFLFPVLFEGIETKALRNYIFVFLYMTGPIHGVLNSIPQIINVRISFKRLITLVQELKEVKDEEVLITDNVQVDNYELEFRDIVYRYKNEEGSTFEIGPINHIFRSSEITFIVGGNGSGKSTLAKLITGLYSPDKGKMLLNGRNVSVDELRQNYSAIFCDFYLFDKLYGIDYQNKGDEIKQYLEQLKIDNKVEINNGKFSTTKLSTGQRKRLAYLVSSLEDRPIYLFDEWASDQDSSFRELFYKTFLHDLKEQGKGVLAITHDDRYFYLADKIIKMELGKIVEIKENV